MFTTYNFFDAGGAPASSVLVYCISYLLETLVEMLIALKWSEKRFRAAAPPALIINNAGGAPALIFFLLPGTYVYAFGTVI